MKMIFFIFNVMETEKTHKEYYSMGEVSSMLSMNPSAIRFYIKEFEIQTRKNSKGNHLFTEEDIKRIRTIQKLVREEGYTLSGAKERLKGNTENTSLSKDEKEVLRKKLILIKQKLENIKNSL